MYALWFEPLVVCEIGLYAEAGERFLRIEIHFAVACRDHCTRILESFLTRPFHRGDEVDFTGTRDLLQHETLQETWLLLEECVSASHSVEKLVPGSSENNELIQSLN